jgi:hypothetical protein
MLRVRSTPKITYYPTYHTVFLSRAIAKTQNSLPKLHTAQLVPAGYVTLGVDCITLQHRRPKITYLGG